MPLTFWILETHNESNVVSNSGTRDGFDRSMPPPEAERKSNPRILELSRNSWFGGRVQWDRPVAIRAKGTIRLIGATHSRMLRSFYSPSRRMLGFITFLISRRPFNVCPFFEPRLEARPPIPDDSLMVDRGGSRPRGRYRHAPPETSVVPDPSQERSDTSMAKQTRDWTDILVKRGVIGPDQLKEAKRMGNSPSRRRWPSSATPPPTRS